MIAPARRLRSGTRPALLGTLIALGSVLGLARAEQAVPNARTLPVVQVLSAEDIPHRTLVNGFWLEALPGIKRSRDTGVRDFRDYIEAYRVVHPYFLRSGKNRIEVSYRFDRPPPQTYADSPYRIWHLKLRVATIREERDEQTYHAVTPLTVLESPIFDAKSLTGEDKSLAADFQWTEPLPAWRWTKGVVIKPTPAEQASLYAAHQALLRDLDALSGRGQPGAPDPDEVRTRLLASTAEYRKACGLWRRVAPDASGQDPVERLIDLATRLDTVANRAPYVYTPTKPRRGPQPLDTPVHGPDEPAAIGEHGGRPSRVSLGPLPAASALRIEVFAGGTLAHLVGSTGELPLRYISNYHDGPWGAARPTKYQADVWFRKNERGQWELDAVYPTWGAGYMLSNDRLERLREQSPF